jgi:hypothetical protein
MSEQQYAVVLVYSTSYALKAEKVLQGAGVVCKLIPVPRQLSSDCGVCVRVKQEDSKLVLDLLADSQVQIEGIRAA